MPSAIQVTSPASTAPTNSTTSTIPIVASAPSGSSRKTASHGIATTMIGPKMSPSPKMKSQMDSSTRIARGSQSRQVWSGSHGTLRLK